MPLGGGKMLFWKKDSSPIWRPKFTMTLKEQFAAWPHESLAVQVTTVVPTGNLVPEGGLQDGGGGAAAPHPPEAVAVNVTTAPLASGAVAVTSAGQVIKSGGCPP